MESLKPILLLMVLSGVGYGVYVALNHAPAPEPTPSTSGDGNPTNSDDKHSNAAPATGAKSSSSGAGLGMSGILNPMGAAANADSAAPHRDETRSPAAGGSLPFGIGSGNLRSASSDSSTPATTSTAAPTGVPLSASGAGSDDRGANLPSTTAADAQARYEFESARRSVQSLLGAGKLVDALKELSRWYGNPVVQPEEQSAMIDLLGQLAGSVIYSRQHWLLPAYTVRPGETMESIAAQYEVPWQLLAKINGVENPNALQPGKELKVIRGPFQGQLDLSQQWLTVFVDGMYAGRFRVEPSGAINKPEGSYPVVKFTAENSPGMAATGPRHISLGGDVQLLCPDEAGPANASAGAWLGAIHVARADMNDVFDMLSERSQVTIRR